MRFWILVLVISSSLFSQFLIEDSIGPNGNTIFIKRDLESNSANRVWNLGYHIEDFGYTLTELNNSSIEIILNKLISELYPILFLSPDDMKIDKLENKNGNWFVSIIQIKNEIRVDKTIYGFTIEKDGKINTIGGIAFPELEVPSTIPIISKDESMENVNNWISSNFPDLSFDIITEPLITILPIILQSDLNYFLTYKYYIELENTQGFIIYVNCENGEILKVEESYINFNNYGNVNMYYYPNYPTDNELFHQGFSGVTIEIVDENNEIVGFDSTNEIGFYQIEWDGNNEDLYTIESVQPLIEDGILTISYYPIGIIYPHISNEFSPQENYEFNWPLITPDTNVHFHVNRAKDIILSDPYFVAEMNYSMPVYLFIEIANANSTGLGMRFGIIDPIDGGYNNWANYSDVIYHEYFHCVVYHLYNNQFIGNYTNDIQSQAMDEGFSDFFAATLNNDPLIGENILPDARNLDNNDIFNPDVSEYENSTVISGALWELWTNSFVGNELTKELFINALRRVPQPLYFSEMLENVLMEDDDDNNLTNGTPHSGDILFSFLNHSIMPVNPTIPGLALGDIIHDGDIDILDVIACINFIISTWFPSEYQNWSSDVNEDDIINLFDLVSIVNIILTSDGSELFLSDSDNSNLVSKVIKQRAIPGEPPFVMQLILFNQLDEVSGIQLEVQIPDGYIATAVSLGDHASNMTEESLITDGDTTVRSVIYNASGNSIQPGFGVILEIGLYYTGLGRGEGDTDGGEFTMLGIANSADGFLNCNILESQEMGRKIEELQAAPTFFKFNPIYPNPFNPNTTIEYELPKETHINISVYDVSGRFVKKLLNTSHQPGRYNVTWNAEQISSGVYIIKMVTPSYSTSQKVILLK